jgi:hypothetical protein
MRRAATTLTLILGLVALALAPAAEAGPFYFFGKLGNTDTSVDVTVAFTDLIDGDDNSASYGLGFKLGRHMAFQAELHDLGNVPGFVSTCPIEDSVCTPEALPVAADSSAISLTVLPHLLLTRRLQLYGKLGVISWDTDISVVGELANDFLDRQSDEDLVYGAGLRFQLPGPFDVFAEYERIADFFDTVAIGATYGF